MTSLDLRDLPRSQVREKEALFASLVASNPVFQSFDEADIKALASFMTVLRFEQELSVVRRGELGSWFGILLTGTLRVEVLSGDARRIRRGGVLGEMIPWQHERISRTATIKGHESGFIATMLVPELRLFADRYPETALKLMRVLVTSALEKQHENLRAAKAGRLGGSTLFANPTPDEQVEPSAPAILRKLLHSMDDDTGAIEFLLDKLRETKTNDEFFQSMKRR